MEDVLVIAGARTPFGTFGGGLKDTSVIELGVVAAKGAMERAGVEPERIDNVVFGNVIQSSADSPYLARHVGLRSGVPQPVPALTVNRLCGSGLQALVSAALEMRAGTSQVALVGGAENMSEAPHVARGLRWGVGLGQSPPLRDVLMDALADPYCGLDMAGTAENLAHDYAITREACDAFSLRSHQLAAAARSGCRFSQEIVPVTVQTRKGPVQVDKDEHIREDTSLEALGRLRPRFQDTGVVTAGNASGINDGAAALVIATESAAASQNLKPLGRLVSWATVGVDPSRMGIGPAPASRLALERAGLTLDDMDLVEVNEAFAAQYLAVEQELGLDREKVNVNGGAVALGHPVGASGARLALTLLLELRARGGRYGLATLCIGGGQGIAAVFESIA